MYIFGHKVDKTVLAYRIKSHDTLYEVKIYEVSKCSRCNKIYEKLIDWYKSYDWYVEFAIKKKEKEFREQQYVGANHQILESAKSKISMIMNNG